jgi:hypothetical protein
LRAYHGLANDRSPVPVPFSKVVDQAAATLALTQVASPNLDAHAVYTALVPRYGARGAGCGLVAPCVLLVSLCPLLRSCCSLLFMCRGINVCVWCV